MPFKALVLILICCIGSILAVGFTVDNSTLTLDDEESIRLSYQSNEKLPSDHYKMGYIAFLRGEPKWTDYFEAGLLIDPKSSKGYFENFLDLCKKHNDIDSAIAILTKSLRSDDIGGYTMLIDFTRDRKRYVDHYIALTSSVLAFPHMYPLWLKFTTFLAEFKNTESDMYRYLHRIVHKPLLDRLLLIGLSFYPRNSDLLIHQALSYVETNELECAVHIMSRGVMLNDTTSGSEVLQTWLSEIKKEIEVNVSWADGNCYPFIHHTTAMHHQYTSGLFEDLPPVKPGELLSQFHIVDYLKQPYAPLGNPRVTTSLQVGCSNWMRCVQKGWMLADAVDLPSTHFVTPAHNLSMIESASMLNVYSSHTLEHLSHNTPMNNREEVTGVSEICLALKEWNRVLIPGGMLLISVPDAETLFGLFLRPTTSDIMKGVIMKILFGGQDTKINTHLYGFYFSKLKELLEVNGFCEVQRTDYFDLFDDTSQTSLLNLPLSLNVMAKKCAESDIETLLTCIV